LKGGLILLVNRIEKHLIKRNNPMWKIVDQKCWQSKNVYNMANYIVRQEFFATKKWIRTSELDKKLQNTEQYKLLGSQASQKIIQLVDRNWKSFFKGIKGWSKKKGDGYFGKPEMPGYKNKSKGRSVLLLKNIQCRIENQKLIFSWLPFREFSGIKTRVSGKLMQVRFVPAGNCYFMEIVYQTEVPKSSNLNKNIIGIDLGVNNLATIGNNFGITPIVIKGGVIKSMNQYYNKKRSNISRNTGMIWNNRMRNLTDKHMRKLDTYMHEISKKIIRYCVTNNVDTIVIGLTKEWKDGVNLGHINNQNFVCIPHDQLIRKIFYKGENVGIKVITTEEDYTSGTSFLDNELPIEENYNKKRRIKRGMFKSNDGTKINADLNASYQIIKKVFPEAFAGIGNRGCDLHPVRLV
jgi:putative transposase